MTFNKIGIINIFLLLIVMLFGVHPAYTLMLTIAQLVFVPFTLHFILKDDSSCFATYLPYISMPAFGAIVVLQLFENISWVPFLAIIYFIFTLFIAFYGLMRFLSRGFTHIEELFIDMGLVFIAIGGAWFLASVLNINTGFSPMITWLTGIHFHYAAFLLPIFIGLLGRIHKTALYKWLGITLIIAPIIVALGITYSVKLELFSVLFYMVGIYGFIYYSWQTDFHNTYQTWLVRLSFIALGITILFSLMYAFGNASGYFSVTIDFMLMFHGVINTGLFALVGIIGWAIHPPKMKYKPRHFPMSMIRGKAMIGEQTLADKTDEKTYTGLVDDMIIYEPHINITTLAPTIKDFYEHTNDYRLDATIKWKRWFMPFAALYRLFSRFTKQLNLPLSSRQVDMTGTIVSVDDAIDGREDVRAWVRKIADKPVFLALYAIHKSEDQTYMNISLPLPWSAMVGILELKQMGTDLRLSSKKEDESNDSGIYFITRKNLFHLPIEEQFDVKEVAAGQLTAQHTMWIFSRPFLTIEYLINKK